jgi:hypothetical protein
MTRDQDKKAVALDLLTRGDMYIHLDPRPLGVSVPLHLRKQPELVLQVGLNMAVAIPDLQVEDEGIVCTLSFNRRPWYCRLPWEAIYALVPEKGNPGGKVWGEDVPPEVTAKYQKRAAPAPETPRRVPAPTPTPTGGVAPVINLADYRRRAAR